MSASGKAMIVVAGLLLFCGISVIGPVFGNSGEFATNTLLGFSADEAVCNEKRRLDSKYHTRKSNQPSLLKAANCCESETCDGNWDYVKDRCLISTQKHAASFQACLDKP